MLQRVNRADVIVIGGGAVGLSIAWHLAKESVSVILLERGKTGGQSSGAAAGMLAPFAEAKTGSPLYDLGIRSLCLYPEIVALLRETTSVDVELMGQGMLRVAMTEKESQQLDSEWKSQESHYLRIERLTGCEARKLEPALSQNVEMALLSPKERHVDPKKLVRALSIDCARLGVSILEDKSVIDLIADDKSVSVKTNDEIYYGDKVVIAGGAWSHEIAASLGYSLPIFPVRGQILALTCQPQPIRHTIYTHSGYLVPRSDGRLIVGATEDQAGFDSAPTVEGVTRLLTMAPTLVPELINAIFESAWAGLRPATADGLPIIGHILGHKNVYAATGHYRNGILLAPITGKLAADEIVNGVRLEQLKEFRYERTSLSSVDENDVKS